jgi:hypothetical protein
MEKLPKHALGAGEMERVAREVECIRHSSPKERLSRPSFDLRYFPQSPAECAFRRTNLAARFAIPAASAARFF